MSVTVNRLNMSQHVLLMKYHCAGTEGSLEFYFNAFQCLKRKHMNFLVLNHQKYKTQGFPFTFPGGGGLSPEGVGMPRDSVATNLLINNVSKSCLSCI